MKNQKEISLIRITTLISFILIPIVTILKFIFFDSYIGDDGFFEKGAVVPYIFSFLIYAIVIALIIISYFYRFKFKYYKKSSSNIENSIEIKPENDDNVINVVSAERHHSHPATKMVYSPKAFPAITFVSILCAFMLIISIICPFIFASVEAPDALDILTIIFRALSIFVFIAMASRRSHFNDKRFQLILLILPAWTVIEIISLFFRLNDSANIYPNVFEFLAMGAIAIFFVTEAKFTLTNPDYYSVARLVAFGQASLVFGSAGFLNTIIGQFIQNNSIDVKSAFTDLVYLALLTYIAIKLIKVSLYFDSHKSIFEVMK